MEPLLEIDPQRVLRRQTVASWIQDVIRPAATAVELNLDPTLDADPGIAETLEEFEVRAYQLDAWGELWDRRQRGETKALVHLATGLGKTSVAVFDVMKFRQERLSQDPSHQPRVLFVSHRNEISGQAKQRFEHFMPNLQTETFKTRQKKLPTADLTFATFQSLRQELHRFDPVAFDYIVYDEVHHSEAETFKEVREYFKPLFELGLTATPDRLDGLDIREYFGNPIYSKGLPEAIAEGWLADIDYHIVFDDIVKQLMEEGFDPKTLKEFHDLFKVKPRNEIIARNIIEERHRIGLDEAKTIVFCEDVTHAEEMAELLGGVAYHSGIKINERKKILSDFRIGGSQVICTVDMFNEGIDIPDARLIVFLRSTQSGTIFEQQLGRGLRKTRGKDKVTVLDFVANIERMTKIREISETIKEYASKLGQTGITEEGGIFDRGGANSGLHIHSEHSDFDFDKLAVSFLEKYNQLREQAAESSRLHQLSNDELITIALGISPDKPLTATRLNELSEEGIMPAARVIHTRFGSVSEFQKACGFEISPRGLSNEELVALALALSPDKALSELEIKKFAAEKQFVSVGVLRKNFGSMAAFHEACGFEPEVDLATATNNELAALAMRLSPNQPLTIPMINELSKRKQFLSPSTIMKRFGSMAAFHEACGFAAIDTRSMDDKSLVALAKRLSPDEPLTHPKINELAKDKRFVSAGTIRTRFGSLEAFHRACGFGADLAKATDEELIALAKELSPDSPLSTPEINQLSKEKRFVSFYSIQKRFGSIKAFQEACGW